VRARSSRCPARQSHPGRSRRKRCQEPGQRLEDWPKRARGRRCVADLRPVGARSKQRRRDDGERRRRNRQVVQASSLGPLLAIVASQTPGESVSVSYLDQNGMAETTNLTLATGPPR
jgi:hypothetical protein